MSNPSGDVMAKLQALRDSFAAQLPGRIQEIEAVGATLCGGKCSETEEGTHTLFIAQADGIRRHIRF